MSYTLYDVSWASGLIERADWPGRDIDYDDPDVAWLSAEFKEWCEQHLTKPCDVFVTYEKWHDRKTGYTVYPIGNLYFEYDADYILFKMRWLDV